MFLNWEITDHRWVWPSPSPSLAKGEGQRTFTPYLPPYTLVSFLKEMNKATTRFLIDQTPFCRDKVGAKRSWQENQIGAKNKDCLEYVTRRRCIQKTRVGTFLRKTDQTNSKVRSRHWKCTIGKCQWEHWKPDNWRPDVCWSQWLIFTIVNVIKCKCNHLRTPLHRVRSKSEERKANPECLQQPSPHKLLGVRPQQTFV